MIISSDYNLPSANSGYFVLTDTHLLIYKSIMKDIHKTDQGSKHLESMHKQRCPDSGHFSSERLMLCWTMEYTTVEYTTVTVECTSLTNLTPGQRCGSCCGLVGSRIGNATADTFTVVYR